MDGVLTEAEGEGTIGMEWAKLKNIIILLLLALNLFFLVLVGEQTHSERSAQGRMQEETLVLLARNQIYVSKAIVPWDDQKESIVLSRSMNRDRALQLVERVVGSVTAQETAGATIYSGAMGTVKVYQSGQFDIQLHKSALPREREPEKHAIEYLKKMGIYARVKEVQEGMHAATIKLWQVWQGEPIFTCQLELGYQDGALQSVHGMRLTCGTNVERSVARGLTSETLLISLVGELHGNREKKSYEISSIIPGYLHRTLGVSAQTITLIPVWRIETTQGESFFLNCLTGKLEDVYEQG